MKASELKKSLDEMSAFAQSGFTFSAGFPLTEDVDLDVVIAIEKPEDPQLKGKGYSRRAYEFEKFSVAHSAHCAITNQEGSTLVVTVKERNIETEEYKNVLSLLSEISRTWIKNDYDILLTEGGLGDYKVIHDVFRRLEAFQHSDNFPVDAFKAKVLFKHLYSMRLQAERAIKILKEMEK